jgi:hypothetical protein
MKLEFLHAERAKITLCPVEEVIYFILPKSTFPYLQLTAPFQQNLRSQNFTRNLGRFDFLRRLSGDHVTGLLPNLSPNCRPGQK